MIKTSLSKKIEEILDDYLELFSKVQMASLIESEEMLPKAESFFVPDLLHDLGEKMIVVFTNKTRRDASSWLNKRIMKVELYDYQVPLFMENVEVYNDCLQYNQKKLSIKYIKNKSLRNLFLKNYLPGKRSGICDVKIYKS